LTQHSETFRQALSAKLTEASARQPELAEFAAALGQFTSPETISTGAPRPPVVEAHLDNLLSDLERGSSFADAIREFAQRSDWIILLEGAPVNDSLLHGLAVARPTYPPEPAGLFGLFLIGPNVSYPLHNHAAREIYHVVSGEVFIQHGRTGIPMSVRAGETSLTPEHRVHALATRDHPCMIAYVWVGDTAGRTWWWSEDEQGKWNRTLWECDGDAAWRVLETADITKDFLEQAGEL
jgi:mannose-6-phosphate isomerase-like protein (cupin superfamily)